MDELQKQQMRLLAALDDSSLNITGISNQEDSLIDEIIALDDTVESTNDSNVEPNESVTPSTPLNNSKQLVFGTPLIQSVSPYLSLPVGNCWAAGVSDILDFENLPESSGKYEKMKGIISKVRKTVKELNDEY